MTAAWQGKLKPPWICADEVLTDAKPHSSVQPPTWLCRLLIILKMECLLPEWTQVVIPTVQWPQCPCTSALLLLGVTKPLTSKKYQLSIISMSSYEDTVLKITRRRSAIQEKNKVGRSYLQKSLCLLGLLISSPCIQDSPYGAWTQNAAAQHRPSSKVICAHRCQSSSIPASKI